MRQAPVWALGVVRQQTLKGRARRAQAARLEDDVARAQSASMLLLEELERAAPQRERWAPERAPGCDAEPLQVRCAVRLGGRCALYGVMHRVGASLGAAGRAPVCQALRAAPLGACPGPTRAGVPPAVRDCSG